jgi:hypothetical protein
VRVKKLEDEHLRWQIRHATDAEPETNAQRTPAYDWDPAPGDPGWHADGHHDMAAHREEVARRERVAQEVENYNRIIAQNTAKKNKYQWDPAPGDPDFHWKGSKEAA